MNFKSGHTMGEYGNICNSYRVVQGYSSQWNNDQQHKKYKQSDSK